jgi:glycosyltransferase involved in cell wall biosynthesis
MTEKIKVLHIVEALGGGVYTYIKDLSIFFGKHNMIFDTIIAYSSKRPEVSNLDLKKELSNGVKLIELDMNKEISLKDFKSVYELTKLCKSLQPQIIHLHSSKAGILGKFVSLFYKKAIVFYTPHGYSFIRKDINFIKKQFYYYIEKFTTKFLGGTTIACGDSEFEYAKKMGKTLLVRNGINIEYILNKFNPTEARNKCITVGTVGRISYTKNPQLFNKIALNNPNLNFVWIGDGESRKVISAPNISVTGWLNREEVFTYLNQLDIYVQTSLWEGLPIAPLEAMTFQKPILATNIGGNKDIVLHGKTGFLFTNENDIQEYIEILKDAAIRKKMGKAGLKRCMENFDLNKNFTILKNIYSDSLNTSTQKD